jgi:hypothetical protein
MKMKEEEQEGGRKRDGVETWNQILWDEKKEL